MGDQRLSSRTAQRAIRLKSKVLTREAASFPGQSHGGFRISLRGRRRVSRLFVHRREGKGKLGRAHPIKEKLMRQFQNQVADPFRDKLTAFLPTARLTTP